MADIGKWFEDQTKAALEEIQRSQAAMYYRFPDSRSARNYIQAQPGDHLLIAEGTALLIEEKCSEVHSSFTGGMSSLWSKKQAAYHRKWSRAGAPAWVMFCNYADKQVEIWETHRAGGLADLRSVGSRIPKTMKPLATGPVKDLITIIRRAMGSSIGVK